MCPGCGERYFPKLARKHESCVVVHAPVVVHAEPAVVVHTRHGKYADLEARRKYRREWMRLRRQSKGGV